MKNIYAVANLLGSKSKLRIYFKVENNVGYVWNFLTKTWNVSDIPSRYLTGFEENFKVVSKEEMDKLAK